jgi:16S rRNA G1207 methylase RsmC
MVAPRVGHLHLLDASADALAVARQNLADATNTPDANAAPTAAVLNQLSRHAQFNAH